MYNSNPFKSRQNRGSQHDLGELQKTVLIESKPGKKQKDRDMEE